ncbi:unnamed protein product [Cylicocyclus nassatus]|uniref:Clarin-3 n=1 Tax=Cylicocyclus nassatus TaxID=53992 RepID=A0AA36HF63_CYLNA|nr:unnamed protein product [Cylicocyclus nassatus]
MGTTFRRVAVFLALIFYLVSLSLVVCSLFTEHWVVSNVTYENRVSTKQSKVNSGLLSGIRQIDWGFGVRYMPFSVLSEIQDDVSFYSRILWIFILFFIAIGILWISVGIITSLLSSFNAKENTIAGPIGTYLWSSLALLSLTASCVIFYIQYHSTMQGSLLTPEQVQAGYSTKGQVKLGFSFYMMLGAIVALYFPPLLIFISAERKKKGKSAKTNSNDPTALLY